MNENNTEIIPWVTIEGMMDAMAQDVVDVQIHCILRMDGTLNEDILQKAFHKTIEWYPHLGCRFVEKKWKSYWESSFDLQTDFLVNVQAVTPENEAQFLDLFLVKENDPREHPMFLLQILRGDQDVLCIKMNHFAGDAASLKEWVVLLSRTYQQMERGSISSVSAPVSQRRSVYQITENFGWEGFFTRRKRLLVEIKSFLSMQRNAWRLPLPPISSRISRQYQHHTFSQDEVQALKMLGRRENATLNDCLVALYFHSLFVLQPPTSQKVTIPTTVDLRRYTRTGKSEAFGNLSNLVFVQIAYNEKHDFLDTLHLVRDFMAEQKRNYIGTGGLLIREWLGRLLPYSWYKALHRMFLSNPSWKGFPSAMTNMGEIPSDELSFGTAQVLHAFLAPPLSYSPYFLLGVSGYNGTITLSSGYCEEEVSSEFVERLFSIFRQKWEEVLV